MGRVTLGQGRTFGDLQIDWLEADAVLAGVTSGRGLGDWPAWRSMTMRDE